MLLKDSLFNKKLSVTNKLDEKRKFHLFKSENIRPFILKHVFFKKTP